MAYVSGKGEEMAIDLRRVAKVEVRDTETLCFAVVTPDRDYIFRARDSVRSLPAAGGRTDRALPPPLRVARPRA